MGNITKKKKKEEATAEKESVRKLTSWLSRRLYSSKMLKHRGTCGLGNIYPIQCSCLGRSHASGLCLLLRGEFQVDIISTSLNHILFSMVHSDQPVDSM